MSETRTIEDGRVGALAAVPQVEALLSLEAARHTLGISRTTLYRLIQRGELPVEIAGRRLIEPDAVRAFIASSRPPREAVAP